MKYKASAWLRDLTIAWGAQLELGSPAGKPSSEPNQQPLALPQLPDNREDEVAEDMLSSASPDEAWVKK